MNSALAQVAAAELDLLVSQPNYPCVAALRVLTQKDFRLEAFPELGSAASTASLAEGLSRFKAEQARSQSPFLSYLAVFESPQNIDEVEFENRLWRQLWLLHQGDRKHHAADPRFPSDPADPKFCFSFEGQAFFVVGMHANSSRLARRFKYPLLVFNLYEQFEQLKARQQYDVMVKVNRARDMKFQGSINPMVYKFGEEAEAVQYSGREVEKGWKCPFHGGRGNELVAD